MHGARGGTLRAMHDDIDLTRVDLNLLVLFDVVLRERHVARAASKLHVSPSAVSHGLRRLRATFDDPLFLRTPRGVLPTQRASELAGDVADVLARVRGVIASVSPFDPARSERRFTIGAPDAVAAVLLGPLLAAVARSAPSVDLHLRHLLPSAAPAQLDEHTIDLALVSVERPSARFASVDLFDDEFVIVARADHPFLARPTLTSYCAERHVLVSTDGPVRGFVDDELAQRGLTRRIALVVSNFMLALAAVAEGDLLCAVPRTLWLRQAARFSLGSVKGPVPLPRYRIAAVTNKAALLDGGMSWLIDTCRSVCGDLTSATEHKPRRRAR